MPLCAAIPPLLLSCDTLAALPEATVGGSTLFAKNSDRPPGECQPLCLVPRATHPVGASLRCQYVSIPQVRETARVLGSRPFWLWGFEHGINEHGVAIGNETIFAREAPAATGLLGMDLVRLGLERADTASNAVAVITGLIAEHGQGGSGFQHADWPYNSSFLIADSREAWVVEAAGRHWVARRSPAVDSITNQVSIGDDWERASAGVVEHAIERGWDAASPFDFARAYRDRESVPAVFSEGRLRRSRRLLGEARGALTGGGMRSILRDHAGRGRVFRAGAAPEDEAFYTLCMHEGPSRTAASLVAELVAPGRGPLVAWVSFGRPCASVFLPVFVEGDLPELLTRGSEEPGDAPWWVFEKLAAVAESDPAAGERIREEFDEIEGEFERSLSRASSGFGPGRSWPGATEFTADAALRVDRAARALLATLAT